MSRTYVNMIKGQAIKRFNTCGRTCECNHIDHDHSVPCGKEIKVRYYLHRRPSSIRVVTSDDIIVVCTTCHQLIQSSSGKIYE